ncbi:hypothetical protein NMY22_g19737 [Coprinellus aureogranulatus]|nr:hypothetical protein NMY22_g19737 [Coprinellus aureogranulatus]
MNLPSLTRIAIYGYNNRSWNALPRNVQLAIKTSLRKKSVSAVEVHAMSDFPVYLLEGCRSLKDLTPGRILSIVLPDDGIRWGGEDDHDLPFRLPIDAT